jgi:hypothetical protein
VSKNSAVLTEPLFSDLDRRRCISLVDVSEVTGFPPSQLRIYALDGTIPAGARRHLDWSRDILAWLISSNEKIYIIL